MNTHQQPSSKEMVDKFFDDQNNIWKSETGLTIAECKKAEKELLQSLLTSHSEAIQERVIKIINEAVNWQGEVDSEYAQGCVDTKRDILALLNDTEV